MKVRRLGIKTHVRLHHHHAVAVVPPHGSDLAKPCAALPEELVEEILLHIPPDEPAHLVRASLACKTWHRILSDDAFRRRYRRFHGTPPLLGYICSQFRDSTVRFVPTTSVAAASTAQAPKLGDCSGCCISSALDCRHGRVLIQAHVHDSSLLGQNSGLIVWDIIAGSQQHLSLPTYPQFSYRHYYAGAVLCAKDGCDHLDCHGGPFLVVLVAMSYEINDEQDGEVWASVYSSEKGAWSSPTTPNYETNKYIDHTKPSLLIGDALYFIAGGFSIVKYDLCKHELSAVMDLPAFLPSILIKGNQGELGVAAIMFHTCIYMWSWQVGNNGVGSWVICRVLELKDTLLAKCRHLPNLICMAEGTNTVFIGVQDIGVFTLDLTSRQVRKIGKSATYYYRPILPYMNFSTPKY